MRVFGSNAQSGTLPEAARRIISNLYLCVAFEKTTLRFKKTSRRSISLAKRSSSREGSLQHHRFFQGRGPSSLNADR